MLREEIWQHLKLMRATSKLLQIQGRSAKSIFILQMPRNIVFLNKRFGRHCFKLQNEMKRENVVGKLNEQKLKTGCESQTADHPMRQKIIIRL